MYVSELFNIDEEYFTKKRLKYDSDQPRKKADINFGHTVFGGEKGKLIKQYKRLASIVHDIEEIEGQQSIDPEVRDLIMDQLKQIYHGLARLRFESIVLQYEALEESLERLDRHDPLNSDVHVRGIGVYKVGRLMQNVREKIAELYADSQSEDPWKWRQINAKLRKNTLQTMMVSLIDAFDQMGGEFGDV